MADTAILNFGERLALQCAVVKGGLPLTLTWLKENAAITNTAGINVNRINDFTISLTIETLSWQHAGHYTCRAQNDAGRAEFTALVVVQGKQVKKKSDLRATLT